MRQITRGLVLGCIATILCTLLAIGLIAARLHNQSTMASKLDRIPRLLAHYHATVSDNPAAHPGIGQSSSSAVAALRSVNDEITDLYRRMVPTNPEIEVVIRAYFATLADILTPETTLGALDPAFAHLQSFLSLARQDYAARVQGNVPFVGAVLICLLLLGVMAISGLQYRIIGPAARRAIRSADKLVHDIAIAETAVLFDHKTGLSTRLHLLTQLQLKTTEMKDDHPLTIIHFDINRLKDINDTLGRATADLYLEHFARTLTAQCPPEDHVARVSVDEFVVASLCSPENALAHAERYKLLVESPTVIEGKMISVTCSIGIASGQVTMAEALMVDADLALDDAKAKGLGGLSVYTTELREKMEHRRKLTDGLKLALQNDEIEPFFQPQVDAQTGAVVGFEALVRWRRPKVGILPPVQFLAIAEDAKLIGPISRIMIKKSLIALRRWREMGFDVPQVSINFTAGDLRETDFVDSLLFDVDRAGLEPKDLCVELLESAMIESETDPVIETLATLTRHGFSVELDDFGTGHASISNLHRIQVTGMKIDRSFIIRLHENPERQKLTRAMLSLAQTLEICSLAEGVESEAERDLLIEMGCMRLQGFGIARPMSATDATAWLELYQHGETNLPLRRGMV